MNNHIEKYHWKEETGCEKCFWATIKVENSHRDLKARVLNLIYLRDPRKRLRGEATGNCDSDNLVYLEEKVAEVS